MSLRTTRPMARPKAGGGRRPPKAKARTTSTPPPFGLTEFTEAWATYQRITKQELMTAAIALHGSQYSVRDTILRCWNCTDHLPEPIRRAVASELDWWRPAYRIPDRNTPSQREPHPRYWYDRIRSVSHAAQALEGLLARMAVQPGLYADGPPPAP